MVAAVAREDPDTAENAPQARTVAMDRPPRNRPTHL